ncbi:hypothetical protein E4H12_08790 [Candidatus Thorarchaeota archaeon]|nr:MAG: hypothetical protein E4H12_08790 [Candidatus Thorarchaeota archaeon]
MNQFNKIPRVLAAVLALMILLSSFQATVPAQADLDPVVVLYDASHSPQFDAANEESGLKLMFDMVNASTRYIIHVHENGDGELDETALNGVDILIIAGSDKSNPYSAAEYAGISEMLANGSSLFLLGDSAISEDSTYWFDGPMQDLGDNIALNTLLDGINMTGPRFSINETETNTWPDTLFDYDHALNETTPWVVQFDSTTWDTTHPIFRNINEILTMTSTLKPVDLASGVGNSYDTSFAQYKRDSNSWANYSTPNITLDEFALKPFSYSAINTTMPSWLSAFEYGLSRVTIVGSTIMFTGRNLDIPETELQWFYVADNARLFMNILDWLSADFVTAPSAIGSMLIISTVVLVFGVAFYLLKKLR